MDIGQNFLKDDRRRNLNDLTPGERRNALDNFNEKFQQHWQNQQFTDQGYTFPRIASKHGNPVWCDNDTAPDKKIPADIFNFDLILGGRRFQVLCDALVRINTEEDLANFSEDQLRTALELCASYRMTCFCAYVAAHREYRKWKQYHELWMAEKRKEARKHLRIERMIDKATNVRKDLGQITTQEIEDYVLNKYAGEYKSNTGLVNDWEENEMVYLELRDTLKDRGMHLQTLLKRVTDHIDPARVSNGTQEGR